MLFLFSLERVIYDHIALSTVETQILKINTFWYIVVYQKIHYTSETICLNCLGHYF